MATSFLYLLVFLLSGCQVEAVPLLAIWVLPDSIKGDMSVVFFILCLFFQHTEGSDSLLTEITLCVGGCWHRTVLGSIPASSGTVESEGRQMKQCRLLYIKRKIQKNPPFTLYQNISQAALLLSSPLSPSLPLYLALSVLLFLWLVLMPVSVAECGEGLLVAVPRRRDVRHHHRLRVPS
jgi:hypothetical protein